MQTHTAMCVLIVWHVLCVLGCVGGSITDFHGDYGDNYVNEIPQDQQEGDDSITPCQSAELSRWDKIFIALEDSHMRQNMLLESLESCCGGMTSLRARVERLVGGGDRRPPAGVEAACERQMEQVALTMKQSLLELQDEESERERRLNATVLMLFNRVNHPKKEDDDTSPDNRLSGSVQTDQASSSGLDMASMQRTLVAIATDLQEVQQQLSRVLEHTGALRNKGGT